MSDTLARPDARHVLLLGSMAALAAVSSDLYLPSLPEVARDLGTSDYLAGVTLTATLLGGAIGQVFVGPLADRFGRRPPALVGIALFVVVALGCAWAPNIWVLIGLRVLQGVFISSSQTVAMAVIRDRFTGSDAARMISRLMLVIGVAPLFAPTVGGWIGGYWGWRGAFVGLAIFGGCLWLLVWRKLPETLPPRLRRTGGVRTALAGYRTLLRDRAFMGYAVLPGLAFAAMMSYVVGSPFVLKGEHGLSTGQFGLVFALCGLGMVAAAQLNAALVGRVSPEAILRFAAPALVLATSVLLVVAMTGAGGVVGLVVAIGVAILPVQLIAPNASAQALTRHGEIAGTAAACIGTMSTLFSGTVSPTVGLLGSSAVGMATVMVCCAVLCLLVVVLATPVYRGRRRERREAATVVDVLRTEG